jgi:hypothetical protein
MTPNQNPETSNYSFNEHKHRYAVWTAARAVQRSFTNTENIQEAIDATGLRAFSEANDTVTENQFDELHTQCCNQLIASFGPGVVCSYGRAAKIIAIYLKTSVILPSHGASALCDVIHPPIDSILMNKLSEEDGMKTLATRRWTQFEKEDYWQVVDLIRGKQYPFNWKLEIFWQSQKEKHINLYN